MLTIANCPHKPCCGEPDACDPDRAPLSPRDALISEEVAVVAEYMARRDGLTKEEAWDTLWDIIEQMREAGLEIVPALEPEPWDDKTEAKIQAAFDTDKARTNAAWAERCEQLSGETK